MPSFTDQLSQPESGRRPVSAPDRPNVLGALANTVTKGLSVFSTLNENAEAQNRTDALNAAAQESLNLAANPPREGGDPGGSTSDFVSTVDGEAPMIPGEVVSGAQDLSRMQRAQTQGRVSMAALEVRTEEMIQRLFNQFPEQKAVISQYLMSNGVNSFTLRDIRQAAQEEETQINSILSMKESERQAAHKRAADVGMFNADPEVMIRNGREMLRADENMRIASLQAKAAQDAAAAQRADAPQMQAAAEREMINATIVHANASLGPQLQLWRELVAAAQAPDRQRVVQELAADFQNTTEQARQAYITKLAREGASPAVIKAVNDQFDQMLAGMKETVSGDLGQFEASNRSLQYMERHLKLNTAQSLQLYNQINLLFGSAVTNRMFSDGDLALPKPILEALTRELSVFKLDPSSNQGRLALISAANILKGETLLADMSEEDARTAMPALYTAIKIHRTNMLDGTITSGDAESFATGYANVANAAVELQPGQASFGAVASATNALTSSDSYQALRAYQKINPERGRQLILGSRIAAAQNLRVLETSGPMVSANGIFKVEYHEPSGRYRVVGDRNRYNEFIRRTRGTQGSYTGPGSGRGDAAPTYEQMLQRSDKDLNEKAKFLNMNLIFLNMTAKDDPTIPTNATPRQISQIHVTGQIPESLQSTTGARINSDELFDRAAEALRNNLRLLPGQIAADHDLRIDQPYVPMSQRADEDVLARLLIGEGMQGGEGNIVLDTVFNRSRLTGRSIQDVINERNAYEPMTNQATRRRLESIDTNSPEYKRALELVRKHGGNPTTGATHFLSPEAMRELGRELPAWAREGGTDVGRHRWFARPEDFND